MEFVIKGLWFLRRIIIWTFYIPTFQCWSFTCILNLQCKEKVWRFDHFPIYYLRGKYTKIQKFIWMKKKQWLTSPMAEDEKWPLWPYSFSSLMVWWRDDASSLSLFLSHTHTHAHTRFLLQPHSLPPANHKHIFSQKDKLSNTKSSFS